MLADARKLTLYLFDDVNDVPSLSKGNEVIEGSPPGAGCGNTSLSILELGGGLKALNDLWKIPFTMYPQSPIERAR